MANVKVDSNSCIGAGQCALAAPNVFDQTAAGIVLLLDSRPAAEAMESVELAVSICPSQSIRLVEAD